MTDPSLANREILFSPKLDMDDFGAFSVPTCGADGHLLASVLNPTGVPIKLEANTTVGTASLEFKIVPDSQSIEANSVSLDTDPRGVQQHSFLRKVKFVNKLSANQKLHF
jgi:hypothetical protein